MENKASPEYWTLRRQFEEASAERDAARRCLVLMMEKHKHWIYDLDGTPAEKAEMELARRNALSASEESK